MNELTKNNKQMGRPKGAGNTIIKPVMLSVVISQILKEQLVLWTNEKVRLSQLVREGCEYKIEYLNNNVEYFEKIVETLKENKALEYKKALESQTKNIVIL